MIPMVEMDEGDDNPPHNCDWDQIERQPAWHHAASSLGYNAYNWESGHIPIEDLGWHEMQEWERNALRILGYDEYTWEDESDNDEEYQHPDAHGEPPIMDGPVEFDIIGLN